VLPENSTADGRVSQIDDYQLLAKVGSGPRSEVWQARASNGRDVALKLFSPSLCSAPNFIFRFEKETAALSALSHPNVLRVVDRGRHRDQYYIASEWLPASSLQATLSGPVSAQDAANIALGVCEALDYTHRRGLPHRNLSMTNVFVDASKHVRVSDFGLARLSKPDFAPDEVRTDLYDLGALLYRLVTGKAHHTPFLAPSKIVPGLPKRLDEVLLRALAEPNARFGRASEMALALRLVTSMAHGGAQTHESEGLSVAVAGQLVSVVVAAGASVANCEAGIEQLGKILAQPGPWRVAYDFGNLTQLDHGIQALLLRLHIRHQKNLERVAFFSPRSLVRASALVVGSSVKRLPWKSFAGEALMRNWLGDGS
jgi:hypothetical protein